VTDTPFRCLSKTVGANSLDQKERDKNALDRHLFVQALACMPRPACSQQGHARPHPSAALAGAYNEEVFRGLDWVVAECGQRGLKLMLTLSNFWEDYGGFPQYVRYGFRLALSKSVLNEGVGIFSIFSSKGFQPQIPRLWAPDLQVHPS